LRADRLGRVSRKAVPIRTARKRIRPKKNSSGGVLLAASIARSSVVCTHWMKRETYS
jgi:hypothetical protein